MCRSCSICTFPSKLHLPTFAMEPRGTAILLPVSFTNGTSLSISVQPVAIAGLAGRGVSIEGERFAAIASSQLTKIRSSSQLKRVQGFWDTADGRHSFSRGQYVLGDGKRLGKCFQWARVLGTSWMPSSTTEAARAVDRRRAGGEASLRSTAVVRRELRFDSSWIPCSRNRDAAT